MLDRWSKIAAIAVAVVIIASAIIGPGVGGIFWLARLEYEVEGLQSDVGQLQTDVGQLKSDVGQLQSDVTKLQSDVSQLHEGQQEILEILQRLADDAPEIRDNLAGHTHDSDGRARFSLDDR